MSDLRWILITTPPEYRSLDTIIKARQEEGDSLTFEIIRKFLEFKPEDYCKKDYELIQDLQTIIYTFGNFFRPEATLIEQEIVSRIRGGKATDLLLIKALERYDRAHGYAQEVQKEPTEPEVIINVSTGVLSKKETAEIRGEPQDV